MHQILAAPDDRLTRSPKTEEPDRHQPDPGPARPDITKPDSGNKLLKRMKKVDPDLAKKYRQRSGQ